MKTGSLLTLVHHLRRIGVTADIIATAEGVTIRTPARVASYNGEELGQLIIEAPTWQRGQALTTLLW